MSKETLIWFFFYQGFLYGHWRFTGQQGKRGDHLLFHSPLPPAHEHWEIYLQLYMWDDYHVFLITTLVFTRLLLDEIYHLIELPFEWLIDDAMFVCLLDELIQFDIGLFLVYYKLIWLVNHKWESIYIFRFIRRAPLNIYQSIMLDSRSLYLRRATHKIWCSCLLWLT